mgnify:CR=1 FL=1
MKSTTLSTITADANGNGAYTDIGRAAFYRAVLNYTSGTMPTARRLVGSKPRSARAGTGWARARGLPRTAGHKRGADAVKRVVKSAVNLGISYLTLFGQLRRGSHCSPGRCPLLYLSY